jgi:hypothetical protein
MRPWLLLIAALGLGAGCVVPIAEVNEEKPTETHNGSGGDGGIVISGWDAGTTGGTGSSSGSGGKPDAGPDADGGVDSGPTGPCATLTGFADDFEDVTPAPFWLPAAEGGALWEESEGSLRVHLPNTLVASTFGGYRLEQGFDLAGCSMTVRVSQVAQSGMVVYTHFWLSYGADGFAEFYKLGEGLYFQYWWAGQLQPPEAVGFSPTVHTYWRFAHDGVNLRWETSPDGLQWTLHALAPLPSTFTALRIGAGATFAKQLQVGPTAIFDEFDVTAYTPSN